MDSGIRHSILFLCLLVTLLLWSPSGVTAQVDPIVIKGSHFFYQTNGSEFFIRGVIYQPSNQAAASNEFIDPLSDGPTCERDVPYLKQLGVNVIRVKDVDPSVDHSSCMDLLAEAGIYVLSNLPGTLDTSISADLPVWDTTLYNHYTAVIDSLQSFSNTLGFFAAVLATQSQTNKTYLYSNTTAMPYARAVVRDMKAYMQQKGYRDIGIGYEADGNTDYRNQLNVADYMTCAEDAVDFYGIAFYADCNDEPFSEEVGPEMSVYYNYPRPKFFSQYSCLPTSDEFRNFTGLSEMYSFFSGAVVNGYFEAGGYYGLVSTDGDFIDPLNDFYRLSSELATISPSSMNIAQYTPSNTQSPDCPTTSDQWQVSPTLPPEPYARLCTCMMEWLDCVANKTFNYTMMQSTLSPLCAEDSDFCLGIQSDPLNGIYGAYSMCNTTEMYAWVMNQRYLAASPDGECDFDGSGSIQTPNPPDTDCQIMFQQAGTLGDGTITSIPPPPVTASETGTATPLSSPNASERLRHNKLSVGAASALGVSLGIGSILIGVGICLFLHRRKRKNVHIIPLDTPPNADAGVLPFHKAELDNTAKSLYITSVYETIKPINEHPLELGCFYHPVPQLDGSPVSQLDGDTFAELGSEMVSPLDDTAGMRQASSPPPPAPTESAISPIARKPLLPRRPPPLPESTTNEHGA